MKTTLYVFSATGNCLTTAQKLASHFENASIRSVSACFSARVITESADCVGFVFPIYYGDMPYPVRELISKLVFTASPYLFAVGTCRGHAGAAYTRLDQFLRTRGQTLSYAASIRMPGNSFLNTPEEEDAALAAQDTTICEAVKPILQHETQAFTADALLPLTPVAYPNNFRGITADETCTGCGICLSVCPMQNITLAEGKAQIGDACATCLSCFHWCPTESIWMSKQPDIARRRKYHHPDITLSDIRALKG